MDGVVAGNLSRRPDRLPSRRIRRLSHQFRAFARREADGRDVVQQRDGECGTAHADGGGTLRACRHGGAGGGRRRCCAAQAPTPTPIRRELGQALAGAYYSAELEATYRIVAGSDAVTLEMGNNVPVALRLTGPDLLRTPQGLELRPVRDDGGRMTGLSIGAGRVRDLAFIKR